MREMPGWSRVSWVEGMETLPEQSWETRGVVGVPGVAVTICIKEIICRSFIYIV